MVALLDNWFSDQQSRGLITHGHNILTDADVEKLYDSDQLSHSTPTSFQTRLIFDIALATAMRISEIYKLKRSQVTHSRQGDRNYIRIEGIVGSVEGTSKNAQGGIKAVKQKLREVFIWDQTDMNGKVNIYEDIMNYISVRETIDMKQHKNERFL